MLEIDHWDKSPEAVSMPVLRCVMCHQYCGPGDLLGVVAWDHVQTVPLALHVGRCVGAFEAIATADGGMLWDIHIAERLKHLELNVEDPPTPGTDGLIRRVDYVTDLRRTADLLDMIAEVQRTAGR